MRSCFNRAIPLIALVFCAASISLAQTYVADKPSNGSFPLVSADKAVALVVDEKEFPGVKLVAEDLVEDIKRVTAKRPAILKDRPTTGGSVIIGTIGKGGLVDELAKTNKVFRTELEGKREKFITTVIDGNLVIAGSDKRGTIYGMYALSKHIGVSPWYWWADVPVKHRDELYVLPGIHTDGEPKVKYRGIFINDEAPALSGWAFEKFGGFNSKFYDKVFELILRLRGNLLWPAMWGRQFYVEDPMNPKLADEYGIVIGTSHHEPMMRAHAEWAAADKGAWDYTTNAKHLDGFWRGGIGRMNGYESLVTIGMRGDGDEPMTEGTAIGLLERIVKRQREIIKEVTDKPAEETPQVWALYKEVQDYYDKGMRVPDDVTLLFSDDNWGNIRRLPDPKAPARKGGYGIYYHFDYVGGPRSYRWINTNQIERVWEQMSLAYQYGADRLWIVNVGDIKPMELPASFFLDYAWDPDAINASDLPGYYTKWAAQQFGKEDAEEIGEILAKYTKYNSRRKPELLDADTYSLDEWQWVIDEWNELESKTLAVKKELDRKYLDAYFQLVEYPVLASANLNRMYHALAMNRRLASRRDVGANKYAYFVEVLFRRDSELSDAYHKLAGGKWNHMMSQTHIGYTGWDNPEKNMMPEVIRIEKGEWTRPNESAEALRSISWYESLDATAYSKARNAEGVCWVTIPDLGRTGSAITIRPSDQCPATSLDSPTLLEYNVRIPEGGEVTVRAYFSPTLDFLSLGGLRYGMSIDGSEMKLSKVDAGKDEETWEKSVADNVYIDEIRFAALAPGVRTLIYSPLDPGLVLQKIVIYQGELPQSYLGPPLVKSR